MVDGFSGVCSTPSGRSISMAVGNTKVLVTKKKTSRRKITSVMEAIEKVAIMSCCRLSAMAYAGSLSMSMKSMVRASIMFITLLMRATSML